MNHSPGPWKWSDGAIHAHLFAANGRLVAYQSPPNDADWLPDDQRLISLAPTMREALLRFEWSGHVGPDESPGCPECSNGPKYHAPDCSLGKLLEQLR